LIAAAVLLLAPINRKFWEYWGEQLGAARQAWLLAVYDGPKGRFRWHLRDVGRLAGAAIFSPKLGLLSLAVFSCAVFAKWNTAVAQTVLSISVGWFGIRLPVTLAGALGGAREPFLVGRWPGKLGKARSLRPSIVATFVRNIGPSVLLFVVADKLGHAAEILRGSGESALNTAGTSHLNHWLWGGLATGLTLSFVGSSMRVMLAKERAVPPDTPLGRAQAAVLAASRLTLMSLAIIGMSTLVVAGSNSIYLWEAASSISEGLAFTIGFVPLALAARRQVTRGDGS
jgi:hypothetical protein